MLQRLRLCRTSDTVFRREIDSRRQWGYGTCYGGIVSPLRRSVGHHHRWLLGGYDLEIGQFLEVASMVVTWCIVFFAQCIIAG